MYVLMYSTVYRWTHVWWSETRFWMVLCMGAAMALIMLGFMLKMSGTEPATLPATSRDGPFAALS